MVLQYALLWLPLAFIAVINGVLRELTYGKVLSELSAHQLSTLTGVLLSGTFVYFVHRLWPIESLVNAWCIGAIWFVATVIFEFGFGHYVAGHSWDHLLNDYHILRGRVWSLFLLWVLLMPVIMYRYV
ncbi:hypothetical protein [Aurantivibrio plasticivorans]